ncbi:L-serine ammonia-lyase [Vibrio gazogenes]|uniref:L-serine dehydratase n=1 Tax=Vibrio gazogenes DSM 21264 = NBRC 103151 TaxID=1123492 RepID=A0A1M5EK16_VIBGA|nr:L-serine ammonia-lyase [Vibrio gazogenes]USP12539.1 L-serine ammonia-lyase [Vibrio gazogenes]SHF79470.1 L-serine dehydratase [Vibrio gazogenes DSM 21264] [Vibrio gazogenes DSM 21264 = NBRC 103151]SJN54013.1 L-serine dehydratase 1 [Vibrio gazogenes]
MSISVFDLFKVGIGPSSSHTVGPMRAASLFAEVLVSQQLLASIERVEIKLYGSLSATGVGHGTDKAAVMGLMGYQPDTVDPAAIESAIKATIETGTLRLAKQKTISFDWHTDLQFIDEALPYHPNAMYLAAYGADNTVVSDNTYYSIGGGFVLDEASIQKTEYVTPQIKLPYEFTTARELLEICRQHKLRISELVMKNEQTWRTVPEINAGIEQLWQVMQECIANGIEQEGILPGGLQVKRRAASLYRSLIQSSDDNVIYTSLSGMDWVNLYALAVNEENAAGGRMVTAPTNGAAGIMPAVLMYHMHFHPKAKAEDVNKYFLAASAIGALCKMNASISGAEVGCQGEVGSASAMAAAGLTEVLGGTPEQVENAAEIALEHNLGLTCDPVGGLVQVPCIERNAIAAVKSINAANMALRGNGEHFISLDKVIRTMRDTGRDMQDKYKETSRGGLAVNAIEC